MKTVLLPVKDFAEAKQRLAGVLSPPQRATLARAMLADVLDALSAAEEPDRVVVYTASFEVMRVARPFGFEVIVEECVAGHSAAVNGILPRLACGAARILAIAADLPRLTSIEIDTVLATECSGVAILPSRDHAGTNGLMVVPPFPFEADYGPGSFERHVARAGAAGVAPTILDVPGIGFDIDTPEDLRMFMEDPRPDSETWRFLRTVR